MANGFWFVPTWVGRYLMHSKCAIRRTQRRRCQPSFPDMATTPTDFGWSCLCGVREESGSVQLSLLKKPAARHWGWGLGTSTASLIPFLWPPLAHGTTRSFYLLWCFTVPEPQHGSSGGKRRVFPRVPNARNSEWSWHKSNEMKLLSSPPSNPRTQWHLENCVLNELARAGVQEKPAMGLCIFEDVCSSLLPSAVWR